jgi:hypothetical protein
VPGYAGIDHLGFQVDNVDDTCQKLQAAGATAMIPRVDVRHAAASGPRSFYEIKYRGPDNQVIDITELGWMVRSHARACTPVRSGNAVFFQRRFPPPSSRVHAVSQRYCHRDVLRDVQATSVLLNVTALEW